MLTFFYFSFIAVNLKLTFHKRIRREINHPKEHISKKCRKCLTKKYCKNLTGNSRRTEITQIMIFECNPFYLQLMYDTSYYFWK